MGRIRDFQTFGRSMVVIRTDPEGGIPWPDTRTNRWDLLPYTPTNLPLPDLGRNWKMMSSPCPSRMLYAEGGFSLCHNEHIREHEAKIASHQIIG